MVVRLVLGVSALGSDLLQELAAWPGELVVVTEASRTAERLREVGIAAQSVASIDADLLRSVRIDPDVVLVTAEDPDQARERLELAGEAFPGVARIAVVPEGSDRMALPAETVIDAAQLAAEDVLGALDPTAVERTRRLLSTLRGLSQPINVVMHDNPDPDAIGAAVGMVSLIEAIGGTAEAHYGGAITHQQNRAFVNLLSLELRQIDPDEGLGGDGGIVLVDHAHPGVNDPLDPDLEVDVIIDHHPSRDEAMATFVDRRHQVGATSTLVGDHLLRTGVAITDRLATALWYGIQVDTDGFRRGVSVLDFQTAARLVESVDADVLERIESPRMTAETLETIADAIANRHVDAGVLVTDVGAVGDRDALAQAADELVGMAGVETVCVFGHQDEVVYASARTRDPGLDLGDAIRIAFDQIGDAGGHEDMAGAQLPFGELPTSDEERGEMVEERFRVGVSRAGRPLPSGFIEDATEV